MERIRSSRLACRRGQATTEYILILVVSLFISVTLARGILRSIDSSLVKFGGGFERALKTGRAPSNIYVN